MAATGRILVKFGICVFVFQKFSAKSSAGALDEDQSTTLIISRSGFVRRENVRGKIVEKIETNILCSITFFRKS